LISISPDGSDLDGGLTGLGGPLGLARGSGLGSILTLWGPF